MPYYHQLSGVISERFSSFTLMPTFVYLFGPKTNLILEMFLDDTGKNLPFTKGSV